MKFPKIREENAVDSLVDMLKQGEYKKATVTLGQLRGNPDEFLKLFKYVTRNTRLEQTALKINPVRARVDCMKCDWKGDPEIKYNGVACPKCRGPVKVLRGREFRVHV